MTDAARKNLKVEFDVAQILTLDHVLLHPLSKSCEKLDLTKHTDNFKI